MATTQIIDPRELNDLAEFAARGGLGSTVASVLFSSQAMFLELFGKLDSSGQDWKRAYKRGSKEQEIGNNKRREKSNC
jgi:hypothetical protein